MRQHMVERGRCLQDVVREMEQCGIGPGGQRGILHRTADELDLVPACAVDAPARLIQHLATLVDGDHLSLRTDRLLQQVQAHAGTAADIQHGLPRLQR